MTRDDFNTLEFIAPPSYGGLPGGTLSSIWVSRMKVATALGQGCAIGTDVGDCSVAGNPYSNTANYSLGVCNTCASGNTIYVTAYYNTGFGAHVLVVHY